MVTSGLGEARRERTGKTGGNVGGGRTCWIGCDSGEVENEGDSHVSGLGNVLMIFTNKVRERKGQGSRLVFSILPAY